MHTTQRCCVRIMLNGDPVMMALLLGFSIASVFQKQKTASEHKPLARYTQCATAQWFEVSLVLGLCTGL